MGSLRQADNGLKPGAGCCPPKRKRGRPPAAVYDYDKLLAWIRSGKSATSGCAALSIPPATFHRKQDADEQFDREVTRARIRGTEACLEYAEDTITCAKDSLAIAKARELAIHMRWKASKLLPQYADKVQFSGGVEHKLTFGDSDARLLEVARTIGAILAAADRIKALPAPSIIDADPVPVALESLTLEAQAHDSA